MLANSVIQLVASGNRPELVLLRQPSGLFRQPLQEGITATRSLEKPSSQLQLLYRGATSYVPRMISFGEGLEICVVECHIDIRGVQNGQKV